MPRTKKPWVTIKEFQHEVDTNHYYAILDYDQMGGGTGTAKVSLACRNRPSDAMRHLDGCGANPAQDGLKELKAALNDRTAKIVKITSRCGWYIPSVSSPAFETYVLLDRIVGRKQKLRALSPGSVLCAGSANAWRSGLAPACAASSYLTFAIAAGFTGAILRPLGYDEGVSFHFYAESSTGKSLAAIAAQSVVGPAGREHLQTFDMTDRALEETSAASNDSLLVLDEAGRIGGEAKDRRAYFKNLAFKVAGGQGRKRSDKANSDASLRNVRYLVIGISTGEEALDTARDIKRVQGEQVRLIGIDVPPRSNGGIFDRETSEVVRAELATRVEQTVSDNFGHPIRVFLAKFIKDDGSVERGRHYVERFLTKALPVPDPLGRRFAAKFAAVYAAAMLAVDFGIVPWSKKEAGMAIRKIHRDAWAKVRPAESEANEFIGWLHKAAAKEELFPVVEKGEAFNPKERTKPYGFRRTCGGVQVVAMFRDAFSQKVSSNEREILSILSARTLLLPGRDADRYVRQWRLKGFSKGKVDVLVFNYDLIAARK